MSPPLSPADLHYELMVLWAHTPAAAIAAAIAKGPGLALGAAADALQGRRRALASWLSNGGLLRLLRTSSHTKNPLDAAVPWHMLSALQASGVLPTSGPAPEQQQQGGGGKGEDGEEGAVPAWAVLDVAQRLIAQVELVGGLCEWAVYVAMHVPGAGARRRLVSELLERHCGEWAGDLGREAFLVKELGVPQALLEDAKVGDEGRGWGRGGP